MGMGYAGSFALTLKDETVKKVVGAKLYNKYTKALEKCPLGEDQLMNDCLDLDDHDLDANGKKLCEKAISAYREIIDAFKKSTKLPIWRSYHSVDDDGDRYDDVNGAYWEVDFDSVYTKTKKAKEFEKTLKNDAITFSHFVQFG